ncbi:MAG: SEL1-like repeat protein [Alphaproteobacteria bacterium]|nr:SEL1-like repeat protein [Alphaproteobacteria bacterium]
MISIKNYFIQYSFLVLAMKNRFSLFLKIIFSIFIGVGGGSLPFTSVFANFEDGVAAYKEGKFTVALNEWRPLAEAGNAAAQFQLAYMYIRGQGVRQNANEALKWGLMSANQGYAPAQYGLGMVYRDGLGVKQNYDEALKWSKLAVNQNYAPAFCLLGLMYAMGQGVEKNKQEAYKWFVLALQGELSDNERMIAQLNHDILKRSLSEDQRHNAEQQVALWTKKNGTSSATFAQVEKVGAEKSIAQIKQEPLIGESDVEDSDQNVAQETYTTNPSITSHPAIGTATVATPVKPQLAEQVVTDPLPVTRKDPIQTQLVQQSQNNTQNNAMSLVKKDVSSLSSATTVQTNNQMRVPSALQNTYPQLASSNKVYRSNARPEILANKIQNSNSFLSTTSPISSQPTVVIASAGKKIIPASAPAAGIKPITYNPPILERKSGPARIQVASLTPQKDPLNIWRGLQQRYPNLLSGLAPVVIRADLGSKGVFQRLQAGPFSDVNAAKIACLELRARNQDCIVVAQ